MKDLLKAAQPSAEESAAVKHLRDRITVLEGVNEETVLDAEKRMRVLRQEVRISVCVCMRACMRACVRAYVGCVSSLSSNPI